MDLVEDLFAQGRAVATVETHKDGLRRVHEVMGIGQLLSDRMIDAQF